MIDQFVADIAQHRRTKQASSPLSEAGGYQGASTHPSAHVDDNLIPVRTGARSAENTADAKNNRESPAVDETAEATAGDSAGTSAQDKHQLNIGTNQSSVGSDPKTEDDFKGTKEDPGTTSVMKADDGEKYAELRKLPIAKLAAQTVDLGNTLLADIATGAAAGTPSASATKTASAGAAAPAVTAAESQPSAEMKKQAAMQLVEHFYRDGAQRAELTINWLSACAEKVAADADDQHAGTSGDGGGAPPEQGGAPPAGLDAAMAGQPGPETQPSPDEALRELLAAMIEMGHTPDEIIRTCNEVAGAAGPGGGAPGGGAGAMGGGMGGAPPAAGGMEMGGSDKMAAATTLCKAANAAKSFRDSKGWRYAPAKTAAETALRNQMFAFLTDTIKRMHS